MLRWWCRSLGGFFAGSLAGSWLPDTWKMLESLPISKPSVQQSIRTFASVLTTKTWKCAETTNQRKMMYEKCLCRECIYNDGSCVSIFKTFYALLISSDEEMQSTRQPSIHPTHPPTIAIQSNSFSAILSLHPSVIPYPNCIYTKYSCISAKKAH